MYCHASMQGLPVASPQQLLIGFLLCTALPTVVVYCSDTQLAIQYRRETVQAQLAQEAARGAKIDEGEREDSSSSSRRCSSEKCEGKVGGGVQALDGVGRTGQDTPLNRLLHYRRSHQKCEALGVSSLSSGPSPTSSAPPSDGIERSQMHPGNSSYSRGTAAGSSAAPASPVTASAGTMPVHMTARNAQPKSGSSATSLDATGGLEAGFTEQLQRALQEQIVRAAALQVRRSRDRSGRVLYYSPLVHVPIAMKVGEGGGVVFHIWCIWHTASDQPMISLQKTLSCFICFIFFVWLLRFYIVLCCSVCVVEALATFALGFCSCDKGQT
jgi:hypothetical protein